MQQNKLESVVGQSRAKEMLNLLSESFHRRGTMPPVGIFGNSGLGRTHLVTKWAESLGANLLYINGTAIKDAIAFRAYFKDAEREKDKHHIVFIDECHNLPRKVQENLLSILETPAILCTVAPREMGNIRCVDGTRWVDKGDVIREALPTNMSFVFATTDPARMKETVLNRLRKIQLEPYSLKDKIEIALTHLTTEGIRTDMTICEALAKRSRSIRHLKHELCMTFADLSTLYSDKDNQSKLDMVDQFLGIDNDGACDKDRDYLDYLARNKIAGLDTLSGYLKVTKEELLIRIEPFLLEKQWIAVTGKGRILTDMGRKKVFNE